MDRERVSREVSATQAATSKKQFISTIKNEFKRSPLASNVVVGLILAGLEQLVEVDFACPCKPTWNVVVASAYFIIPGFSAMVLMLVIRGFKCKTSQKCDNVVPFGLGPFLTWLVLVFLDGQYFACAMTNWSGRFVIIGKAAPLRWCQPDNNTLSEERMNQTQQWYFHSQVVGLMILVFSTIILVVYECIKRNKHSDNTGIFPAHEEEIKCFELERNIIDLETSI